jgi:uncharacterized membrane protein (DUF485 family)
MDRSIIARRLRRVVAFSLAASLPYVAFVTLLIVSPATMGLRPFGGSVSLAIYLAFFLFAWPIFIAAIYLRGIGAGARS